MRRLLPALIAIFFLLNARNAAIAAPARAAEAPSKDVVVLTRIRVIDIPNIDEKDRSCLITAVLDLEWKDARVKPGQWLESQAVAELANIWHPEVEIDNEREPRKSENQVLIVKDDGMVTWQERFDAKLNTSFDLHSLPFDSQELPIVVQSFTLDHETITLEPAKGSGISKTTSLPEWRLDGLEIKKVGVESNAATRYSELEFDVLIHRRSTFYFYSIVVPSILVVLVSFTTLWYDTRQFNAIVGPGVSCMLVLIALSFTVSSYLPRVPYVTTLNKFSLQCYVFVFTTIILNAVVHAMGAGGDEERSKKVRTVVRFLLPLAFVVSNIVIYVTA